jgi:hypothetical protein
MPEYSRRPSHKSPNSYHRSEVSEQQIPGCAQGLRGDMGIEILDESPAQSCREHQAFQEGKYSQRDRVWCEAKRDEKSE